VTDKEMPVGSVSNICRDFRYSRSLVSKLIKNGLVAFI
jgi:hypothetical protein